MKIQRKRVNDIVSKYNVEGITSNGILYASTHTYETQGFRLKNDALTYYVMFNNENGKYSLSKRLDISPAEPYYTFTNEYYYSDFKHILVDFLEKTNK